MKILIIAAGKEKDFSGHELVREYTDRASHYLPVEWKYILGKDSADEEARILKALDAEASGSAIIALDEKGKEYDSANFAEFIQGRLNEGLKTLIFIIGGSYGLSDAIRSRARVVTALSKLTFTHQLARLILAEQLYRAMTILKGEKYHH